MDYVMALFDSEGKITKPKVHIPGFRKRVYSLWVTREKGLDDFTRFVYDFNSDEQSRERFEKLHPANQQLIMSLGGPGVRAIMRVGYKIFPEEFDMNNLLVRLIDDYRPGSMTGYLGKGTLNLTDRFFTPPNEGTGLGEEFERLVGFDHLEFFWTEDDRQYARKFMQDQKFELD